ncbi:MAG: hypothetical protein KJO69_04165 [Gammaproteobacteria bacterium]|nr:hypothetical protein [Gammaproteobacteria bacterium]
MSALDSGMNRAVTVWHRRAGKDKTLFNIIIKKAFERVGTYYYFFPEFSQGRRVIWDGIDNDGFRFLHHIPKEVIVGKPNKTDMKIDLINGSIIQIIGTDKFDKIRGSNPVGCVFSEYAFQNPAAWATVRPILSANGGWAVFNSTPFGKNHFYDLYMMGKDNPNWYTNLVTVEESVDENGNRYVPQEVIDEDRASGYSEEMIQQEYYCDFTANSTGFYYLKYMEQALEEGRITRVPYESNIPVETWWDIGVSDSTAIWFTQIVGRSVHVIDFYQHNSVGVEHYAKHLQTLPYVYGTHHFPHDMSHTEFGTGRSRLESAEGLFGAANLDVLPKLSREDGINAARLILPKCYFDEVKCEEGIKALQNYHRQWDDKLQEFKNLPVHDWASHPADAFRYFATGLTMPREKSSRQHYMRKQRMRAKGWMLA